MRSLRSNRLSVTPECNAVLIDDLVVSCPVTASARSEDPGPIGERHSLPKAESFSIVKHDSDYFQVTLQLNPSHNCRKGAFDEQPKRETAS